MSLLRDDPELLVAFREGRRDALERVYRAYVQSVDRLTRALVRAHGRRGEQAQESAAADLLQEVFIRAFSPAARHAYDGQRDFEPYLATIARNCFIDIVRAEQREAQKSLRELSLVVEEPFEDPDAGQDPRVMAVLAAYVAALPRDVAGVYEQRFVRGQSQSETSAVLGVSRRFVRTMEGRLRRGLRRALVRA